MSETVEQQRATYDRRQRAWVFLVLGALAFWALGLGGMNLDGPLVLIGYAGFVGGLGMIAYALTLFRRPRP